MTSSKPQQKPRKPYAPALPGTRTLSHVTELVSDYTCVYLFVNSLSTGLDVGRTAVVSVRIPKELKEELERLGIDYSREVREFLRKLVRARRADELIRQAEKIQKQTKKVKENLSAKVIREDRDSR